MWVRFTDNFDWKPKSTVTVAYRKGNELNVTRECADKAIALGKAEILKRGVKDEPDGKNEG